MTQKKQIFADAKDKISTLSMESLLAGQENVSRKAAESQRKKEAKKNLAPWRLCVRSAFLVPAYPGSNAGARGR